MPHCALSDISIEISPEFCLWTAVLLKAVKDAMGVNSPRPHVVMSAREFLQSGDADWIWKFFGLDDARVKKTIQERICHVE
jgi:hypothetical protein